MRSNSIRISSRDFQANTVQRYCTHTIKSTKLRKTLLNLLRRPRIIDRRTQSRTPRIRPDLSRSPIRYHMPLINDHHTISKLINLSQIMSRKQNSTLMIPRLSHRRPKITATLHIHTSRGLIKNQKIRISQQRNSKTKTLLLPTRTFLHKRLSITLKPGLSQNSRNILKLAIQRRHILHGLFNRQIRK